MPNSTFVFRSPMPVSAEELYRWHARPQAFQRLGPPWESIELQESIGSFGIDPYRITFRTSLFGPIKGTWVAGDYDFQPGRQFQDQQLSGPFAYWNHTHRFLPAGSDSSVLEDYIEYRLPLGGLGRLFGSAMTRRRLHAMFTFRHALTRSDLTRHARYADRPRLTIAVTGSRGLIGSALVPFLTTGGHQIIRLVSSSAKPKYDDGTRWVNWKPEGKLNPEVLNGIDAVIHLAGDNVASGRWTTAKKQKIRDSRTVPTRNLAEAIAAVPAEGRPKVLVSASAIGIYGNRDDELLSEDSSPGEGFFAGVAREWEEAATPATTAGIRVVHPRIGVVLTPQGGALGKQLPAFRAGAGAVLGTGRQWVSWIEINDLVGALHECVMNSNMRGAVNCVAPHAVVNRDFTKSLGQALARPAFFWLPAPALRVMFGELADEALLCGTRVTPRKLLDSGFRFDHPDLLLALRFLLGRM